jgi:hypothetical protein
VFPNSRLGINDQCKVCRDYRGGVYRPKRFILLSDNDGVEHEFLQWTCDICGHTQLFATEGPNANPLDGEIFPGWDVAGPRSPR